MIVWGGNSGTAQLLNTGGRYAPASDSWSATNAGAASGVPSARYDHSAVWTGTEMIIWGGRDNSGTYFGDGARYNPVTDTWAPVSGAGAPSSNQTHAAVWTGQEMIIWSDRDGARYNPVTDTWSPIPRPAFVMPQSGFDNTAVWTGTEMLVWGAASSQVTGGGRYNPVANSWRPITRENTPEVRDHQEAVWTGTEMIVWGGESAADPFPRLMTGGRYTP